MVLEFEVQADGKTVPVPPGGIKVQIQDTTGSMKLTRTAAIVRDNGSLRKLEFAMRPGKYKVTANTVRTGARGQATFTVGNSAADPKRIVLR